MLVECLVEMLVERLVKVWCKVCGKSAGNFGREFGKMFCKCWKNAARMFGIKFVENLEFSGKSSLMLSPVKNKVLWKVRWKLW